MNQNKLIMNWQFLKMIYNLINDKVKHHVLSEIKRLNLNIYEVEIREKKRSLPQNKYYWKLIEIISNDTGYTKDELHESFKSKFLGMVECKTIFGDVYERPESSTELTKENFTKYLNKIHAFAAMQNINLPTLKDYGYE
jgi:hypothetical protein